MMCPKCEIGTLKKIEFRSTEKKAWVCDICDSLWFEDEVITEMSGHALSEYAQEQDRDYEVENIDDKDQDHEKIPMEKERRFL